jgi:hypothetical protein
MIAFVVGIVFLVVAVLLMTVFKCADEVWTIIKGSVPPVLILSGLAAAALGISQIKDKIAAKKEEEEMKAEEAKAEPATPEEPEKKEESGQ